MTNSPILVWFRNDLRLDDHPALFHAAATGAPVIPVYLHTPRPRSRWERGGASQWWLHHALTDLQNRFAQRHNRLVLRSGDNPEALLRDLMRETGAEHIYWNRRYEPDWVDVDTQLKKSLPAKSFPGSVLREPQDVFTQTGNPYKVFTPYYRACQKTDPPPDPLDEPEHISRPDTLPDSEVLDEWNLLPTTKWDAGFYESWEPTLQGAETHLQHFLDECAASYKTDRDFPAQPGTSRLSPYLHFGQISSRRIWHEVDAHQSVLGGGTGAEAYTRQLVWRDFATQMLFHFPHTDWHPLQEKYADFPWRQDDDALRAWQKGQTGYPIVDAGMRELWHTGWMHNRLRMIVASFLVKDLLISWRAGAEWFWDTLVDADLANNSFGWQWAGGCGADAAPYFRIFNPVRQSERFDADCAYIRHWVPEVASLTNKQIHTPWQMDHPPPNYPPPMVDHKQARDRALEALSSITEN